MSYGITPDRGISPRTEFPPRNKLLRDLSPDAFQRLKPSLELVPLKARRILHYAKLPIEQVYFIERGLVSVVASTEQDSQGIESWLIGLEGLAGVPVLLGVMNSPHRRTVQTDGNAWAIRSADLILAMDEIPELRRVLFHYVHTILVQTAQIGACNARHPLMKRLARWLLMAQDRLEDTTLPLTQETISRMLGVRRASVTETIRRLEQEGAVSTSRGQITIEDRSRLQALCCHCYSIIADQSPALLDSAPGSSRLQSRS